jgi:hypothetical protein
MEKKHSRDISMLGSGGNAQGMESLPLHVILNNSISTTLPQLPPVITSKNRN